jgi:uncharacterized protein
MPEFIDFDEIDKHGPRTYHAVLDIPAPELDRDEVESVGPITIDARAAKGELPGEYLVDGDVAFTGDLRCARCVEPYPFANASSFHLRFRPRPEASAQNEEVEINPEELDVEFYAERQIPLRDLANEQIQLSIPMKPLCDEKCFGLCPTCGANRNRESCDCQASLVDDRWGALQEIREQIAKKKSQ